MGSLLSTDIKEMKRIAGNLLQRAGWLTHQHDRMSSKQNVVHVHFMHGLQCWIGKLALEYDASVSVCCQGNAQVSFVADQYLFASCPRRGSINICFHFVVHVWLLKEENITPKLRPFHTKASKPTQQALVWKGLLYIHGRVTCARRRLRFLPFSWLVLGDV